LLCLDCFFNMPRTNYHLEKDNPVEKLFWGRCKIEKASAFSFYTQDSRIRKIVHSLKYKGMKDIGPMLGKMCANELKSSSFFEDIEVLIPVPLHPSKLRQRGYNQSELIVEGISEATGISVDTTSLSRSMFTHTQTRMKIFDRWLNVEGVFCVHDYSAINGKHILLIDDVVTTGSTIEACVNELVKGENVRVSVLTMAVAVN
ncbi:MAG: ComF family protein, partial [Bacteroidales bacterium]|nr:ComF family protein [Bacteroidales bacterium]